ncbi:MAG: hypothetical protein PVF17_03295 [Ignavibacteria bacterium]|jgi:hypothetical protein
MNVFWCKCILQSRCRLKIIDLNNEHFDSLIGVFIIWYGDDMSNVVSVGHGTIRDKLIEMQLDKRVLEYGPDLFVTWAAVPRASQEGVEAFLSSKLNPLVHNNISYPEVITVNLP